MVKILKHLREISQLNIFKTFYYYLLIKYPRGASFYVGPNSLIQISKKAKVNLKSGCFRVNESWFHNRRRIAKGALIMEDGAQLTINGDFTMYDGSSIYIAKNAILEIGAGSFINNGATIDCYLHIRIGAKCLIADYVRIQDSDSHTIIESGENKVNTRPIIIENNVWIGKNAMILKGVTIGTGAVVAAGAVVTRNVEPNCLVAGNPAKVIKHAIQWK
ncbi:MAG TPA: acyltransferase [Bacteroidales bacterium]|nr:acyltransferase [Bacteroidales bacterium]